MHDPTMDDYIYRTILALWFIGSVYSIYLAGRIAQRRGRSFKTWAWISGILIGPLAFPLLFLLPNLQRRDPQGPNGVRRPTERIGAVTPGIPGNRDSGQLGMSFA
jgi:MFS family permease